VQARCNFSYKEGLYKRLFSMFLVKFEYSK